MKNHFLNLFVITYVVLSCNSANSQYTLRERADDAYNANDYKKAFILYDSLIKHDSTKGEFYYRVDFATLILKAMFHLEVLKSLTN